MQAYHLDAYKKIKSKPALPEGESTLNLDALKLASA